MTACNVCLAGIGAEPEQASVHSNVRRFKDESFSVHRCARCGSIHATDDVDLAHYYAHYPFHGDLEIDWRLGVMYRSLLGRLQRAGLSREHSVLDYGCGGGLVVRFLKEHGYSNAVGYDRYSPQFEKPELLERRYDLILTQDVLEHVPDPRAMLDELGRLAKPGGVVVIGTPNATAIDLSRAEAFAHTLHQPYHRHMYSERALLDVGRGRGWELVRYYPRMYVDTLFPFINQRFVLHYLRAGDDTLDYAFDPPRLDNWRLYSPMTVFWALFGYFFPMRTDVMAVFRTPR